MQTQTKIRFQKKRSRDFHLQATVLVAEYTFWQLNIIEIYKYNTNAANLLLAKMLKHLVCYECQTAGSPTLVLNINVT